MPVKYQNAVFQSLSSQKKLSIWNEKIDSVLLLEWDEVTKAKILDLRTHLQSIDFSRDRLTPPTNTYKNYLDAWENDVLSNHRMDTIQFIINFCTFMTYGELDKLVYHPETLTDDCASPTGGRGTVYNCGLLGKSACKRVYL